MTAVDFLRLDRKVPDWHQRGACQLFPGLDWIDAKPGSVQAQACRLVCSVCPVRLACAVGALERGEAWGMWGGLDRSDRKLLAARFGYPPPGDPPPHGTDARYKKWYCHCPECKAGHALYEAQRRERVKRERFPLLVLIVAGKGRRGGRLGQLVLPLGITRDDVAAAA